MSEPVSEMPVGEVAIAELPAVQGGESVLGYLPRALVRKPRVWAAYSLTPILLAVHMGIGIGVGIVLYAYATTISASRMETVENFNAILKSNSFLLSIYGLSMAVNAGAVAILLYFSKTPAKVRVGMVRPQASLIATAIFALGAVALSLLCGMAMAHFQMHSRSLASISRLVGTASRPQLTVAAIIISLIGPVLEELIFRGYIQTRLAQRHGPVPAIFVTSVFFGGMHFDPAQSTFAFLLGLLLGAIAYRAGSIVPAIVAHMAVNAVSVCLIVLRLDDSFGVPVLLACVLLFPTSLVMLYLTKPSQGYDRRCVVIPAADQLH